MRSRRHRSISGDDKTYEGILISRSESSDNTHIVVKMKSGYKIGVRLAPNVKIEKIGKGTKPTFASPPLPPQRPDLPKVVIMSTGGTIASRVDYRTGSAHQTGSNAWKMLIHSKWRSY